MEVVWVLYFIYESSEGQIDIILETQDNLNGDTLFFAYYDGDLKTDRIIIIDTFLQEFSGFYKSFRTKSPGKVFWWGRGTEEFLQYLPKNSQSVKISGDPFVDTLRIEY